MADRTGPAGHQQAATRIVITASGSRGHLEIGQAGVSLPITAVDTALIRANLGIEVAGQQCES